MCDSYIKLNRACKATGKHSVTFCICFTGKVVICIMLQLSKTEKMKIKISQVIMLSPVSGIPLRWEYASHLIEALNDADYDILSARNIERLTCIYCIQAYQC